MQVLIPDVLRRTSQLFPDRVAAVFGDRQLSYRDLQARTQSFANLLRHGLNLAPGSRFAVLAQNTIEFPEIYLGAALAGCACVPINYRLVAREVVGILADANVRALIVDKQLEELATGVLAGGFDGQCLWLGKSETGRRSYDEMLEESASSYGDLETHDETDVVLQMYTSGTTGFPKGAMLTHRSLLANSWSMIAEANVVADDICLLTSPLSHLAAGARITSIAHVGATLCIEPRFDASRVLHLIESGAVTTGVFVPSMVHSLIESIGDRPGPRGRFRRLTYGTAPMPQPLLTRAMELLDCEFQQGYGLTEATANVTILSPRDHVLRGSEATHRRLESVGRPTIGVSLRVVDDNDRDLPAGEPGEVIVRGANVMAGYWNRPEATEATLRGGWLRTGDIGSLDDGRYLYLVDRKSDMLISGGLNVYPREVEVQLEEHPDVQEVAVIGVPDPHWGEVPVAFVVRRGHAKPDSTSPQMLDAWCRSRLAGYKVPKHYEYVAELPRNAMGKVLKRVLRDHG